MFPLLANCLVSELGEVDSAINGACPEGFVGSAQIPAGRACFNDTAPGSIAMYFCECEEQYMLQDFGGVCQSNRVCQSNGTWSGTIPDFERVTCMLSLLMYSQHAYAVGIYRYHFYKYSNTILFTSIDTGPRVQYIAINLLILATILAIT